MYIDLFTLLFIIFLTLKLCKAITWSWWWITAPLWLPVAVDFLRIISVTKL